MPDADPSRSEPGALLEIASGPLAAALANPGAVTLEVANGEQSAVFELDRPELERLLSRSHGDAVRFALSPKVVEDSGILEAGEVEAHSVRGMLAGGAVAATLVIGGVGAHNAFADHSTPQQGIPPHHCTPTFCYFGTGTPSTARPTGRFEFLPAKVNPPKPEWV